MNYPVHVSDSEWIDHGFDLYQEKAAETAIYPDEYKIMYPALGLGEVGELQNKIKKIYRDNLVLTPELIEDLGHEVGDVLWYLSALCRDLGLSLGWCADENLKKLASRKERNVIGGSGDNR